MLLRRNSDSFFAWLLLATNILLSITISFVECAKGGKSSNSNNKYNRNQFFNNNNNNYQNSRNDFDPSKLCF